MFNRKSIYALNKKDPDAIVYMDANEVIVRLTREDFASEEEFLKWKSWSDGNYHTEDNQDVVEGKHNTSIDGLSEAAFSIWSSTRRSAYTIPISTTVRPGQTSTVRAFSRCSRILRPVM